MRLDHILNPTRQVKEIMERQHLELLAAERAKINGRARLYRKVRCAVDPEFKLMLTLRSRISSAVRAAGAKKYAKTALLVGCSVQRLREHLEAQFKPGMTWENHGEWHIDHIKPCASYDLRKSVDQQACFHWSNLQPLWANANLSKGDRTWP